MSKLFGRFLAGIIDGILMFIMVTGLYAIYRLTPFALLYDPGIDTMVYVSMIFGIMGILAGLISGKTMMDD